jgi:hypothetical protein
MIPGAILILSGLVDLLTGFTFWVIEVVCEVGLANTGVDKPSAIIPRPRVRADLKFMAVSSINLLIVTCRELGFLKLWIKLVFASAKASRTRWRSLALGITIPLGNQGKGERSVMSREIKL